MLQPTFWVDSKHQFSQKSLNLLSKNKSFNFVTDGQRKKKATNQHMDNLSFALFLFLLLTLRSRFYCFGPFVIRNRWCEIPVNFIVGFIYILGSPSNFDWILHATIDDIIYNSTCRAIFVSKSEKWLDQVSVWLVIINLSEYIIFQKTIYVYIILNAR